MLYDTESADGLAMRLVIAEVERLPTVDLSLPLPEDAALGEVCARISARPDTHDPIGTLAAREGVSARARSMRCSGGFSG